MSPISRREAQDSVVKLSDKLSISSNLQSLHKLLAGIFELLSFSLKYSFDNEPRNIRHIKGISKAVRVKEKTKPSTYQTVSQPLNQLSTLIHQTLKTALDLLEMRP